jgi:DNA-binding NarL/FixJ family response regulator
MKTNPMRGLVVEDDRSWQEILREILSDAGLEVDVADSFEMALTFLHANPHKVAVVDLSLRGQDPHNQDGLQVLDAVRRLDPGCVAMLMTGFATVELAVSALTEYNAFTCLRKEAFQRSQFRDLLNQALASAPTPSQTMEADKEQTAEADQQPTQERPSNLVLVVDDDAGWRSILSELLIDAGYQVRLCHSFGEALGYLRREKYSLAVVDLSLSGQVRWESNAPAQELEGYRLLASTRAAGIATIVVSGVANPSEIERAYEEQGIFSYMEKQAFDRRAFLQMVEEANSRAERTPSELDGLTDREREVLDLLARGLTNKEIAETLVISTNTVKRHLKAIFSKLDIHTRAAAVAKATGGGEQGGN